MLASSASPPPPPDAAPKRTVLVTAGGKVASGYGSAPVEAPPASPIAPGRRGGKPKRRRSTRVRVLRWAIGVVAVIVLIAGAGYGYLRYRFGQIRTLACHTCTVVNDGQPFNVLLVGSDTRAGNTGAAAQQFGSSSLVSGQRSDTIKILHVDPASGSARLLSIPRDTFVDLSNMPANSGLAHANKINTAFNYGPGPLIATIQNTLGIPITHFVVIDFQGLTDAVNAVGGIYLNFPYPVRDNDNGTNNAGLQITKTGCQYVSGAQTLALARSRFFQYYANGSWHYDPSSDIGRIQRQNIIIDAVISRARGSYNPFTLNSFLGSIVHDITVDDQMSFSDMVSLATTYHAFSPSSLKTYTLPTVAEVSSYAGDVEVVQQPQAEQVLTAFLGAAPNSGSTPPLDGRGNPVIAPSITTTAPPAGSGTGTGSSGTGSAGAGGTTATTAPGATTTPSFDPTICSG